MRCYLLALTTILGCLLVSCEAGPKSGRGLRLPDGDIERGKTAFLSLKCNRCHTVEGVELPPPDEPASVTLALGGEVYKVQTYGELVTSIIHPSHKLAKSLPKERALPGGRSPMTNFNEVMTVSQLVDLVAFLQSHYRIKPPDTSPYMM